MHAHYEMPAPPPVGDYAARPLLVTPQMAAAMLATMSYERQRRIRARHVEGLARELRRGAFKPGPIEINTVGGVPYLIDGYHRLHAIVAAGVAAELIVVEREVGTMAAVDANYAVVDTGLVRSSGDRTTAYDLPARFGVGRSWVSALGHAVAGIAGGFEYDHNDPYMRDAVRSDTVRILLMEDWLPELRRLLAVVEGVRGAWADRNFRKTRVGPTLGVILVTLRHQPHLAERFWGDVVRNDGLRVNQPERVLTDFLERTKVESIGPRAFSRAVANCWNAAYEGRSLTYALRNKEKAAALPIKLKGTPYDGREVVRPSVFDAA